jgi:hypothetical protein
MSGSGTLLESGTQRRGLSLTSAQEVARAYIDDDRWREPVFHRRRPDN